MSAAAVDPIAEESLRGAVGELLERIFAAWAVMPPRQWAETVRRMPGEHGSTRPYTFDYAPYQRDMYDAVFEPRNQEVVFQLFSRAGKTEVVQNALGYTIDQRPCRAGVMWPTLGQGKKWSKDDFMGALVEPTPALSALIGDDTGRRKSDNTILHKIFAGGLLDIVGANAPGDLRRMKARFLYADEIDAIVEQSSDEGDQLAIFKKRGAEFPDTVEIYCSYPSMKRRSRIEAKLLETDHRQWQVTCPLCGGEPFVMHRNQLRYAAEHPELARLECPRCTGHLDDGQRYRMMRAGVWVATRPYRGKAGFQANALVWPHPVSPAKFPGGFLQVLAQAEIDAERSENPERSRRVIVNTVDAETYEAPCDVKPEHSKLFLRREEYDPAKMLPEGVLWITWFADVQADRIELGIEGFGEKRQVWALDYQVLKGSPLVDPHEGVWAELDRILLTTTYAHPSGATLRISGGLVDRGYQPDKVFAFTRSRLGRGIAASRGATELARPIVERRARREGKPPARVWQLGTHEAKDIIYQALELDNPTAAGYRHYPKLGQFSEPFFKMLTAEDSEMRKGSDGKWHRWFGCEQGVRNEALDIAVGCMAGEKIHKPNYARIKAEFEALRSGKPGTASPDTAAAGSANGKKAAPPADAKPPTRSFVSRGGVIRRQGPGGKGGGFVGDWRR